MGQHEAADILKMTLEEEKETDASLSALAENDINWEAEKEEADDKEEE
jgi:ferritin-like metal-binding protein YciE